MNKYRNKKVGGFDSIKEKNRIAELRILEKAGKIFNLRTQVKFELIPSQYENIETTLKTKIKIKKVCIEKACSYYADAVYNYKNGDLVVEDVKGVKTEVYRIKKKLMLYVHGIKIKEY